MNELFREAGKRILRTVLDYQDSRQRSRHYDGIISIDDVMSGEVIKVDRGLYDHYGIFVRALGRNGRGELHAIQYTGRNGHNDFNGIVRETPLDDFLDGAEEFMVCRYSGSTCTARLLVRNVHTSRDSTSSCTLTDYTILHAHRLHRRPCRHSGRRTCTKPHRCRGLQPSGEQLRAFRCVVQNRHERFISGQGCPSCAHNARKVRNMLKLPYPYNSERR